jgi:hypothetical protein
MPWYESAKSYLLKFWLWCKKHWKFIIGALIPIGLWLVTKLFSRKEAVEEVLESTNEAHKQEIRVLETAHDIETAGTREAQEKHDRTVDKIKAEHDAAQISLDSEKEARINEIVREHGDNPDEITRKISALTGIRVMQRQQ